jgi:hypothetical protein
MAKGSASGSETVRQSVSGSPLVSESVTATAWVSASDGDSVRESASG